jgi:hypothetical protein
MSHSFYTTLSNLSPSSVWSKASTHLPYHPYPTTHHVSPVSPNQSLQNKVEKQIQLLVHQTYYHSPPSHSLQVRVKPHHRLRKRGLLCELDLLVTHVAADGKAVLDARVEVDLPGLAGLGEEFLGAVTFFGGEDLVGFYV